MTKRKYRIKRTISIKNRKHSRKIIIKTTREIKSHRKIINTMLHNTNRDTNIIMNRSRNKFLNRGQNIRCLSFSGFSGKLLDPIRPFSNNVFHTLKKHMENNTHIGLKWGRSRHKLEQRSNIQFSTIRRNHELKKTRINNTSLHSNIILLRQVMIPTTRMVIESLSFFKNFSHKKLFRFKKRQLIRRRFTDNLRTNKKATNILRIIL